MKKVRVGAALLALVMLVCAAASADELRQVETKKYGKLARREWLLPKKLYSRSGRVRIACKDTLNVAICLKATANINLSPLRWERRTRSCFKMGVIRN